MPPVVSARLRQRRSVVHRCRSARRGPWTSYRGRRRENRLGLCPASATSELARTTYHRGVVCGYRTQGAPRRPYRPRRRHLQTLAWSDSCCCCRWRRRRLRCQQTSCSPFRSPVTLPAPSLYAWRSSAAHLDYPATSRWLPALRRAAERVRCPADAISGGVMARRGSERVKHPPTAPGSPVRICGGSCAL